MNVNLLPQKERDLRFDSEKEGIPYDRLHIRAEIMLFIHSFREEILQNRYEFTPSVEAKFRSGVERLVRIQIDYGATMDDLVDTTCSYMIHLIRSNRNDFRKAYEIFKEEYNGVETGNTKTYITGINYRLPEDDEVLEFLFKLHSLGYTFLSRDYHYLPTTFRTSILL